MFGDRVLTPDPNRDVSYDSGSPEAGRWFVFSCASCHNKIKLDLPSYIGTYQDLEDVLGPAQSEAIRLHFGLRNDKSLADGWPKFRIESCSDCGSSYLVYVAVHEPANGWFRIVPQGITQLPSNNSFKPKPLRGSA